MLTQLATVKARLGIGDASQDALLTRFIEMASARFDKECCRTFARTEDALQEFDPLDTRVLAACYPLEAVTKFELKANEDDGWVEQTGAEFGQLNAGVVVLQEPLGLAGDAWLRPW